MLLLIYAPHAKSACLQCSKHKSKIYLQRSVSRGVDTINLTTFYLKLFIESKIMKRFIIFSPTYKWVGVFPSNNLLQSIRSEIHRQMLLHNNAPMRQDNKKTYFCSFSYFSCGTSVFTAFLLLRKMEFKNERERERKRLAIKWEIVVILNSDTHSYLLKKIYRRP
jgi:hypothetical protein